MRYGSILAPKSIHFAVVLMLCGLGTRGAPAQAFPKPEALWTPVHAEEVQAQLAQKAPTSGPVVGVAPSAALFFTLDTNAMDSALRAAPSTLARGAKAPAAFLSLPRPDGTFATFAVEEYSVMAPELAAKYPEIKTYRGRGVDDPMATAQIDYDGKVFHAQVLSTGRSFYVDPYLNSPKYASYNRQSFQSDAKPFQCMADTPPEPETAGRPASSARKPIRFGEYTRTYRLAVACTGEYAQKFYDPARDISDRDKKLKALRAINLTVNRVSGVYEHELGIGLQLVPDTDKLIFLNPKTDDLSNDNAGKLINESQRVIDNVIGDKDYDIGHTFATDSSGLAGLGVVCKSGEKARGVTGTAEPSGDPYDIDYVAHEMGHQFGANHTFNGVSKSCNGRNRNGSTACEPGSGSTIMSYAGICEPEDLQPHSDPYFHSVSLAEILDVITTGEASKVPPVPSGNNPPTLAPLPEFTIPASAPFTLIATGSDADGPEGLVYCWEQRDLGPAAALSQDDDGLIPLFRSYPPTASPSRTLPQVSCLLDDKFTDAEKLPRKNRSMLFSVTLRDRRGESGAACVEYERIHVTEQAGPFVIEHPTGSGVLKGAQEIRWSVANTDRPPVNVQRVNILLSEDGGVTFPYILALDTPNDGRQMVVFPSISTHAARVKIESKGNVFFAISPANFSVEPPKL